MSANGESVAIVGLGGCFPACRSLDDFWAGVAGARDLSEEVPASRWALPRELAFDREKARPDKVYSTRACLIDEAQLSLEGLVDDCRRFDRFDPMIRLGLKACALAFKEAKTEAVAPGRSGVVLGNIALPTDAASLLSEETLGREYYRDLREAFFGPISIYDEGPGVWAYNRFATSLPSGVAARALGLGGPHFTVDAACSSALYAIKLACDSLLRGRTDMMLAGGLSRPDCLYTQMGFSQLLALSPTGRCAPFDHRGDGLVVGEGAGVVVLKRLSDALRDGDTIYAVVKGIGLSNDIEGSLLAPSREGQLRAMRAAYEQSGLRPDEIDLIECHATGTPVGDRVEFGSLCALWGESRRPGGRCVIGSVKSNIGHLLTGAGAAGLIKVLLAMRRGVMPPTANFERPAEAIDLARSPFEVLSGPEPWERRTGGGPRRAAVSGFGFGGTNAHLIVEEYIGQGPRQEASAFAVPRSYPRIAIVGIGARVGPQRGLAAVQARLLGGEARLEPRPAAGFRGRSRAAIGWFIERLRIPANRYRIPPKEVEELLPQQLLMLELAREAISDSRLDGIDRARMGAYIGIELDMGSTDYRLRWSLLRKLDEWGASLGPRYDASEITTIKEGAMLGLGPPLNANRTMGGLGSIVASRVAREFGLGGPSFVLQAAECSGIAALSAAVGALQARELDCALAGAVDFCSDPRAVEAIDAPEGMELADGGVALVLKRFDDAEREGDRVYAVIEGIGLASGGEPDCLVPADAVFLSALRNAYEEAGAGSGDAEYVLVQSSRGAGGEAAEARALGRFLGVARPTLGCAASDLGYCGAASALLSLVKAGLSLYYSRLPPFRDRDRADRALGVYPRPATPRYWLHDRASGPRRALVCSHSITGGCGAVLLAERPTFEPIPPLEALFAFEGDDTTGLRNELLECEAWLRGAGEVSSPGDLAAARFRAVGQRPEAKRGLAILARGRDELELLLRTALELLPDGDLLSSASEGRIIYAGEPLYRPGSLALVFPGSGAHYGGMGRELRLHFPAIARAEERETLPADTRDLIMAQVALGVEVSDVLRLFGVRPDAAIGYSLGETTALFALGAWRDRDEMRRRLSEGELFRSELCGPCSAAREAWSLPSGTDVDWVAGVLDRPAREVETALSGLSRAYLLIVNAPDECVIGGRRQEIEELLRRTGGLFLPLHGVATVHCEVAKRREPAYRNLHTLPTVAVPGTSFYGGASGRPYPLDSESVAGALTDQALSTIDFPRLIDRAYADGARIFLEVGPGDSCSRMIGKILDGKPFAARSACVEGRENSSLLRTLGLCVAQRVPVSLDALFPPARAAPGEPETGECVEVLVGPRWAARADPQVRRAIGSGRRPAGDTVRMLDERGMARMVGAAAAAHEGFLRLSDEAGRLAAALLDFRSWLGAERPAPASSPALALDRGRCLEFARGSAARALGHEFAPVDAQPKRVRLPDEPLMLVDRVLSIEAVPLSMGPGRIVTEHDVMPGSWYLDGGLIPTGIAVEAGQADLLLSGFLGIDFETAGRAVYRLLDAEVAFSGDLPSAGSTIRYAIEIEGFFRQDDTWLFRFHFDAAVDGRPFLTMREGCAGFFTRAALEAGRGIISSRLDERPARGRSGGGVRPLATMARESLGEGRLDALRRGDLTEAFGSAFARLPLTRAFTLPGDRLRLVHRIAEIDPEGGRYGVGLVRAETDIRPDDWFLTCHFVDDRVMPGTLMYECCLQALRVYLLRLGWIGEEGRVAAQPIPGVRSRLKCRGQVTESTKIVAFEVSLKKLGYGPEPYAIADALIFADGKAIVRIDDLSLRFTGLRREGLEELWRRGATGVAAGVPRSVPTAGHRPRSGPSFTKDQILAFAEGKPSEAFGAPYRVFDGERFIARLPRPPYQFIDRVTSVTGTAFALETGCSCLAEFDLPADHWCVIENRQEQMPFAALMEIALQPCGFLAAYAGSALHAPFDLHFRNLGGEAVLHRAPPPGPDLFSTRATMTKLSRADDVIIQHFDFFVESRRLGLIYSGATYFGYFTREALADQVGIRDASPYKPREEEFGRATSFPVAEGAPLSGDRLRMIAAIDCFVPDGGPLGLGLISGSIEVDPDAWFFAAHFYQDPVWPGSLGLEAFLQLLKIAALHRWGGGASSRFSTIAPRVRHLWTYRGQIAPSCRRVECQACVTAVDESSRRLTADGLLSVDGRIIYRMRDFAMEMLP